MGFDSIIGGANDLAAAANPYMAAAQTAEAAFAKLFSLIGSGRREADQIVPVQNQVGELLGQINSAIQDPATTVDQLLSMRQKLIQAGQQFNAFTRDPHFKDGRASHQARLTIFPLLDGTDGEGNVVSVDMWNQPVNGGTLGSIDRAIAARGGAPAFTPTPTGTPAGAASSGSGGGLLALAALAIPFLLKD